MSSPLAQVTVPIVTVDDEGEIRPNTIFHRPLDNLHSRCIEYPYCASRIRPTVRTLLDVGSAKADSTWISWLSRLPFAVYALDYDVPPQGIARVVRYVRADIRATPYPDRFFDAVVAVSSIEHIGLSEPQVAHVSKPKVEPDGDLRAVQEIARILKPGGQLVMTVPFGRRSGLILGDQARTYDIRSIRKFEAVMQLSELVVYEYASLSPARSWAVRPRRAIGRFLEVFLKMRFHEAGLVTWKRVDPLVCAATHRWHVEAVACCVWEKRAGN